MFQRLIDLRSSVLRELAQWLGKEIIVEGDPGSVEWEERFRQGHVRWNGQHPAAVQAIGRSWVTFRTPNKTVSEPLEKLTLSWHDERNCLKVLVKL
jgi:hypothetical protein